MHWLIQENLINPQTLQHLKDALTRQREPFTTLRMVPIFNEIDGVPPSIQEPCFGYGSTGMKKVVNQLGLAPGYIDDNLEYPTFLKHYDDRTLNVDAHVASVKDLRPEWETFFVRPVDDRKAFAGTIMTREEWPTFQENIANISDDPDATLRSSDDIIAAPLKTILAEYRFFVIGHRIVTGSRYKHGDVVESVKNAPENILAFALDCVEHWSPNVAYTLDVAMTPNGPKILECNSANSAGFYACDLDAIVQAVKKLA
jgi:hypothetical protein